MKRLIAVLLVVFMVAAMCPAIFAEPSPESDKDLKVDIYYHLDTVTHEGPDIVKYGDTYTFTPKSFDGYEFDYFTITGEFENVTKGVVRFDSPDTITILPKEDLVIDVYYKNAPHDNPPVDDDPVSPHTGDYSYLLAIAMLIGLCGVALCTRKLLKNR